MSLAWIAILLGVVEGLTEFVPVSSTGHLIVVGRLLGFEGERAATFEIFIQLGAILAVVILERRRFLLLARPGAATGLAGPRGCALLATTCLPFLTVGFFAHHFIKERLWSVPTVALAMLAGGVGLLAVERFRPPARITGVDAIGWRQALLVGLFQLLALWPGMSRSAATIAGGLLGGLDRRTAATYSFLVAVPVMLIVTAGDLKDSWSALGAQDVLPFALGFVVSFVVAWAAVRSFVAFLGRYSLRPFAWYRIAVAPLVYALVK